MIKWGNFIFALSMIFFSSGFHSAVEGHVTACKQSYRDPLLQLVSLQKATGCWVLDPDLAAALGKTSEEMDNKKPASVSHCQK